MEIPMNTIGAFDLLLVILAIVNGVLLSATTYCVVTIYRIKKSYDYVLENQLEFQTQNSNSTLQVKEKQKELDDIILDMRDRVLEAEILSQKVSAMEGALNVNHKEIIKILKWVEDTDKHLMS